MGGAGDDTIFGGGGNGDRLEGGDGDDTIYGSDDGADVILAGAGWDIVFGRAGNDSIDGGSGDDILHGESGDDTIEGGAGRRKRWAAPITMCYTVIRRLGAGDDNAVDYVYGDFGTNADEVGSGQINCLAAEETICCLAKPAMIRSTRAPAAAIWSISGRATGRRRTISRRRCRPRAAGFAAGHSVGAGWTVAAE
ncbi:MAG: calcium-binding protein [Pirellulaceae bacterium]